MRVQVLILAALLALPVLQCAAVDTDTFEQRYRDLERRFDDLKHQRVDVSAAQALIPDIERTKKRRDRNELARLMNEFERRLNLASSTTTDKQQVQDTAPLPAGVIDEVTIIRALSNNENFIKLLQYRGQASVVDKSGGAGRNKGRFSDVAAQRDALWVLGRGIAENNSDLIDRAIRAMEYAFTLQEEKGNFRNAHGVSAIKAVGADAFFLQAFGHAYLLLAQSSYKLEFLPRLDVLKPKLRSAMSWLKENEQELYRQDKNAPNRLAFDGLAFLLNGMVLADASLVQTGKEFLHATMERQRADGVFLEHGGYDSSYQAVNIGNLQVAWLYTNDEVLRRSLFQAMQRGVEWEKSRIRASGEVIVEGNTRTGLGQETFFGKSKDVNYAEVALALFYWAKIADDPAYERLGNAMIGYALSKRGR